MKILRNPACFLKKSTNKLFFVFFSIFRIFVDQIAQIPHKFNIPQQIAGLVQLSIDLFNVQQQKGSYEGRARNLTINFEIGIRYTFELYPQWKLVRHILIPRARFVT